MITPEAPPPALLEEQAGAIGRHAEALGSVDGRIRSIESRIPLIAGDIAALRDGLGQKATRIFVVLAALIGMGGGAAVAVLVGWL